MESRDARFAGRFVTAVVTTGIYCRPGCPARLPARRNVRFFVSAAGAEGDGFRPCRRCRPDAAARTPVLAGAGATVARALRLIADEGAILAAPRGTVAADAVGEDVSDNLRGVDALAARLGVSARHLRRLFEERLGASPHAIAQTRRVHFARQLLDETTLPITEIALAAGFGSVRRFNDAFRASFHTTPTALRRSRPIGDGTEGAITLRLAYRPPLALASLVGFLAVRALPGVEVVNDLSYSRTVLLDGEPATIHVAPIDGEHALALRVDGGHARALAIAVERARRVFDLDSDPLTIDEHLARDPRLAPLVAARPGLRVPGAWDPFELAVRAIVGQQVSVARARDIAAALVERHGVRFPSNKGALTHLFPTPEALARADAHTLGMPRARGQALIDLARVVADRTLVLDGAGDLDQTVARLTALTGIGEWTAHYIALRALREPDAFPASDLVLRKSLALDRVEDVEAAAAAWRPWRAYAALHLWSKGE